MTKKEYQDMIDNMTWSFSRVNGFGTGCKYCWAQNYILKRRDDSQDNCFSDYGLGAHDILEKYYKGELFEFELLDEFKAFFPNVATFPNNKWVDLRESYYDSGIEYFSNVDRFEKYDIIEVEPEMTTTIKGYKFTGYIDLILKHKTKGYYVIVDHKSKSKFKSKKELAEYGRQLYLYSTYIKEKYGEFPEKLMFNRFRKQQKDVILFREEDYEEARDWMVKTIKEIRNAEKFPVTSDSFFGKVLCNFRNDENHIVGDKKEGTKSYVLKLEDIDLG